MTWHHAVIRIGREWHACFAAADGAGKTMVWLDGWQGATRYGTDAADRISIHEQVSPARQAVLDEIERKARRH